MGHRSEFTVSLDTCFKGLVRPDQSSGTLNLILMNPTFLRILVIKFIDPSTVKGLVAH
jgi:hypothetical protein